MNDRAVSILDNYELQILRTWKGRGAILCETNQGIKILKEYHGIKEKLYFLKKLLDSTRDNQFSNIEGIVLNKEGEPFFTDTDHTTYIVKDYFEGRECNIREESECETAVKTLARLHRSMTLPEQAQDSNVVALPLVHEFEKRNKELRRVRKYLKEKGQKTEFELYLQHNFDYFFEKALETAEELNTYPVMKWLQQLKENGTFCHGDYQYHNILFHGETVNIFNLEKSTLDDSVRDLYLFARKLLEKNNWDIELGKRLLDEYNKERTITIEEQIQLIYRFRYPEKFWKIVNFYYNNTKSWIPLRNKEKLEKILYQEKAKDEFIDNLT